MGRVPYEVAVMSSPSGGGRRRTSASTRGQRGHVHPHERRRTVRRQPAGGRWGERFWMARWTIPGISAGASVSCPWRSGRPRSWCRGHVGRIHLAPGAKARHASKVSHDATGLAKGLGPSAGTRAEVQPDPVEMPYTATGQAGGRGPDNRGVLVAARSTARADPCFGPAEGGDGSLLPL